jgi:hypothetical protein
VGGDQSLPDCFEAVVFVLIVIASGVFFERVTVKSGIEKCPEGYIRTNWRSKLVPLEEVVRFDAMKSWPWSVYAVGPYGR